MTLVHARYDSYVLSMFFLSEGIYIQLVLSTTFIHHCDYISQP